MKMRKFELIKGGKDEPTKESSDFRRGVVKDSEIEEERMFSEGEILGLIEQIALEEGVKPNQLEKFYEAHDADGNLISLSVKVKDSVALGHGWKSIEYDFMIKGKHAEAGFSDTTCISRVYNIDFPERFEGGVVAEYKDGQWQMSPGKISPKVESAGPIN